MADRDQAIRDLADALNRLARADQTGDQTTVRLTLGPAGDFSGADAHLYRSADISPNAAKALTDAIDSMNAYLAAEQPETADSAGEWSAAAVAQTNPDLYGDVTDLFMLIDPLSLLDDVLNSANPKDSARAFEDLVTGDWDGEL